MANPTGPRTVVLKTYKLYWAPEGRVIKIVRAENAYKAKRLAPAPLRQVSGRDLRRGSTLMRVADKEMIAAIRAGKPKVVQNTRVRWFQSDNNQMAIVSLHGHTIARVTLYDGKVIGLQCTLAGWPTPTTRSRLNALCQAFGMGNFSRFGQTKGVQYYNDRRTGDRPISPTEWIDVDMWP